MGSACSQRIGRLSTSARADHSLSQNEKRPAACRRCRCRDTFLTMSSSSPYAPAAQLLTQIWTQHKSLKTLAYDKKGRLKCTNKATYAIVCHTLENKPLLDGVIERVPIHVRNEGLLYVLLYELLLGPNQSIRGGGALKRQIMDKVSDLRNALVQARREHGDAAITVVSFPRYVRINTLQADPKEAIDMLNAQHDQLFVDAHVPNLLVLPPATSLHQHTLVQSGKVILQDKGSCLSALCLIHGNEKPLKGDYLDACAAPGNKTSHLAALIAETLPSLKQKGTVYALDRSSTRLASLQRRMEQLVNSNKVQVVTQHMDFLKTDPSNYETVRGILLDPSCSGSGIFTSPDRLGETPDKSRIQTLSNFQLVALKHAMSFPKVERIVYSTCSLHDEENECVVSQALAQCGNEWHLAPPACLQHWKRRGHEAGGLTKVQANCLIRADKDDETNGFFVAYFERKSNDKEVSAAIRPRIVPPKGITVYNGEFLKATHNSAAAAGTTTVPEQVSEPETKVSSKPTVPTVKAPKKEKPMGKKRGKKLAWKRKQMEQKLRRIAKKNASKEDE